MIVYHDRSQSYILLNICVEERSLVADIKQKHRTTLKERSNHASSSWLCHNIHFTIVFCKNRAKYLYDIDTIYRIQLKILKVLQKATKTKIITKFQSKLCVNSLKNALIENQMFNICVIHAKRIILQMKNMQLMKTLREIMTEDENSHWIFNFIFLSLMYFVFDVLCIS